MVEPLALAAPAQTQPAFYSWHVGTLRDGKITADFPLTGTSWSDVMDDAGALSGTMNLADPDVAALNPYLTAEPCRCFLAVSYTDETGTETFLAGGPIWTHAYDHVTRKLTIGAAGLWSYYDHRKVLPVLTAGVNPATVTTEIVSSLATTAKNLVQLAHSHTAGSVPVVLPADIAGTITTDYPGSEMHDVGQALRDLTALDGGPEIQFVPRRRSDDPRFIEWVMRTGTPTAPLLSQAGADWVWDASAAQSSVASINVNRDGSAMGSRAWVQGAGSESETLFGRADDTTLTDAGFPLLEVTASGSQTDTVQAQLDSAATALLGRSRRPVETWLVKVRRDDAPNVAQYQTGDYVQITIAGNPYLPSGTYRTRIQSRSGDDSPDVALQLAPTIGGV